MRRNLWLLRLAGHRRLYWNCQGECLLLLSRSPRSLAFFIPSIRETCREEERPAIHSTRYKSPRSRA